MEEFGIRLRRACEEAILLFVKYGIAIFLIIYAYLYFMDIRRMSINGDQAAAAILQFQAKGYLPKFPLSDKPIEVK